MKEKSPRNRTLQVTSEEGEKFLSECITLSKPTSATQWENKVIFQDTIEAIQFLPDNFIDLLLITDCP